MLRTLRVIVPLVLLVLFPVWGCTDEGLCTDSGCKAGNKCVNDDKGESKCRLLCDSSVRCPDNYQCVPTPDGTLDYCTSMRPLDIGPIKRADKGQWGSPCNPSSNTSRKIDANPDCDAEQYFWCHAKLPTDGEAYCTQFQCETDLDCAQGFACEDVNKAPNAVTDKPSFGETWRVCQKRTSCSDCKSEADCYPLNGIPSHCVTGTDNRKFCMIECSARASCGFDQKCVTNDEVGANVCFPNAGSCHGDGGYCSPCRSDADCTQNGNEGICYQSNYSSERFCTAKSKIECRIVNDKLESGCPKPTQGYAKVGGCFTGSDPTSPKNQCWAGTQWGTDENGNPNYSPGCWAIR